MIKMGRGAASPISIRPIRILARNLLTNAPDTVFCRNASFAVSVHRTHANVVGIALQTPACSGLPVSRLLKDGAFQAFQEKIRLSKFAGTFSGGGENVEDLVPTDYGSLLRENEYHKLADEVLECLQEKIERIGEDLDIEGFDTDHAEGVLTVRLGTLGTYVINKQTPNRQIWLSSPVSGPARFDWDEKTHSWVYRRTKAELLTLLQEELIELLDTTVNLA